MQISLQNISVSYGKTTVLEEVSLDIGPGVIFLEGKNGSGKSTLLNIIAACQRPTAGTISIDGQRGNYQDYAKRNVSVCPSINELPLLLTAAQYLSIASEFRKSTSDHELIYEVANDIDFDISNSNTISTYSHGMRQKLCILTSLVGFRKIVLFDESFSALDGTSRKNLLLKLPSILSKSECEIIISVNHTNDHETLQQVKRLSCENRACHYICD